MIISAPTVITGNEREAVISVGEQVKLGGTNAQVGLTLDVTPTLKPDSVIHLKLKVESSELAKGENALSTVSTTTELELIPNGMALVPVGNRSAVSAGGSNQKLHMFICAGLTA